MSIHISQNIAKTSSKTETEERLSDMIEKYSIRTDLALEQKERFEADNVEISGVVLEENYDE